MAMQKNIMKMHKYP
ncbi:hypothetical protein Celaphus_00006256 [Cervus elaphus hippelaphus]|uniref:Uncharacterized protein n=1 Tax=Cervus elaphus hippelaphus TaxID=46360 RepID=A0A212CV34_CEREH|nr:hypothetical protein Celaphus_00006256 [Cervus elaphus hippelaphus]